MADKASKNSKKDSKKNSKENSKKVNKTPDKTAEEPQNITPNEQGKTAEQNKPAVQNGKKTEMVTDANGKKGKKKHKKATKVVLIVVAVILVLVIAIGIFVARKLNLLNTGGDDYKGSDAMVNDINASDIDSITDADSLTALLKEWATNGGDKMKSKYVKNILLVGVDSDSKLSDSMLLCSVNVRTKKVNLVSFYRDSYTYINDDGDEFYAKLNAAYMNGGAKLVQKTIEDDYKIVIDDYAVVDYDTFPTIIDALGGVDVDVTQAEATYLNKTWYKWTRTNKKITFTAGTMHMDGEHALMFCRIRKLDSDTGRTDRQRRVIVSIMDGMKGASLTKLNKMINVLLPNVKTSMSKKEVLNLASDALSDGWTDYPISQTTMPPEKPYGEYCTAGYAGDQWIWICDYEGAAAKLQKMLYGQTNIKLSEDRVSALDFAQGQTSATTNSSGYTNAYTYANTKTYTTSYSVTAAATKQATEASEEAIVAEDGSENP